MTNGVHYTFDVRFGAGMAKEMRDLLEAPDVGHEFLEQITERISMTPLLGPFTRQFVHPERKDESGVSGFILFVESHASFHTYPERRYLAMDVFSCREFAPEGILEMLRKLSGDSIEEIHIERITRGEAAFQRKR